MVKSTVRVHGPLLDSLSANFRQKRSGKLKEIIQGLQRNTDKPFKIIDFGGTFNYWNALGLDFLEQQNIIVTCVNLSYDIGFVETFQTDRLVFIQNNVCDLRDIPDNSFDFVHSNSVIEHVGRWTEMRAFASEVHRLAPAFYIQTPYFWCPIDPHFPNIPFYHWMPMSWRLWVLQKIGLGRFKPIADLNDAMRILESSILLDGKQFRSLFPDSKILMERLVVIPKSMIAIKA